MLRYSENSSCTKAACIYQASNKTCAACYTLLHTPTRLRHHYEPFGRRWCDCVDYCTKTVAMLRNHNVCLVEDEEGGRGLGDSC